MKTAALLLGFTLGALVLSAPFSTARAHCQVPCGIYDDEARLEEISEHIMTIEKSMQQILELSEKENPNYNQIVRWVNNKDHHADELIHIVSYYFMNQRVKPAGGGDPGYEDYVLKLTLLHQMMVEAMVAKQTTEMEHVKNLRDLLGRFSKAYMGE